MKFKSFTVLLIIAIAGCTSTEPVAQPSDQKLITNNPPDYLKHWIGSDGILAKFGDQAEIGALVRYSGRSELDYKMLIFDQTGKYFLNDVNGQLTGPHRVKDLFKVTDLWGFKDKENANTFALSLDSFGVESGMINRESFDGDITFICKNGNFRQFTKNGIASLFNHKPLQTKISGPLEAMTDNGLILLSDSTGEKIHNANGDLVGSVRDLWPELPSNSIEALCNISTPGPAATSIIVLGEDGLISNGQYIYVSTTDSLAGQVNLLVDLKQ